MTVTSALRPLARWTVVPGAGFALVMGTMSVTSPAHAQPIGPVFFGMHDSQIRAGSVPEVPTGSTRLWDTGTTWQEMTEPPDLLHPLGRLNLQRAKAAVATAEGSDLRPMLVLGQTPTWHEDPTDTKTGPTSMPRESSWKEYVGAVASEFGDRVDYQIWNEPNVDEYWTGSVEQMATLTIWAQQAIEGAMPAGTDPTIVAPSFPLRLKGQRTWYRQYWSQRGVANSVDVVSVNLYPAENQGPEDQLPLLRYAKSALPKAARTKPMWNTEINFGLKGGGEKADKIMATKQAAYVARTLLLNAASPIRRTYWYAWRIGNFANTHLVNSDGTLTAAGRAWRTTRGWLIGSNTKSCRKATRGTFKGVYTCTARKGRTTRRFYWKPSGRAVTIRTPRSTLSWSKLSGRTFKKKGIFRIKRVGQSPIMVTSRR